MNAMDRIEHEHARAVIAAREAWERERDHHERTIYAAVGECMALRNAPVWQLKQEYAALQEALYYLTQAMEKAQGKAQ